jgi:hypothetical protein
MSAASIVATLIKESPYLARMLFDLLYMYLTLGSRVKKTRKAFEEQLVLVGMAKDDAKRMSSCFEVLRSSITGMLKEGIARGNPGRVTEFADVM